MSYAHAASRRHAETTIVPNSAEAHALLPEELSRIRQEELRAEAQRQREVRRHSAGRWWRSLARYATERAEAAERR